MHPPSLIPQRTSLVAETANALRAGIQMGKWQEYLPGERRLCDEWRISRPTLRAALAILARENRITVAHGQRTRIVPQVVAQVAPKALTVGLLSPEPLDVMPPFVLRWVDELRGQLASSGHLLQVHIGRAGFGRTDPATALATLVQTAPATVWVLYQATEPMQRWFADNAVPCVVVGSLFTGIELPSVDRDYRAVCRHAAGWLASHQHRHIALLLHYPLLAGDVESERGFNEGISAVRATHVTGRTLQHNGTGAGLSAALDEALRDRTRPTALLIGRTSFALTAFTYLLSRGVRIPQEMAVICRDDDHFLECLVPPMASYTVKPSLFAKQIFRLVMRLVDEGRTGEAVKVMPVFCRRGSA